MIRHALLLSSLLLLATSYLHAQPGDPDAAADTMMKDNDFLFDSLTFSTPLNDDVSLPLDQIRPAGWSPEFATPYRRVDYLGLEDAPALLLSYDRADGLYLGLGSNIPSEVFFSNRLQGHFGFGYSFGSHYWQVLGGLKRDFLSENAPLRLTAEGHIITDTRDAWKMAVNENTAFALLAGVDTRDYFQRRGFSVGAQQFLNRRIGVKAEYRLDSYKSSRREAGWSLFGPEQPFHEVPPIAEGRMSSVVINLIADYMSLRSWDEGQFGLEAQAEFGSLEESFQHYVLDARARLTAVERWVWLAARVRVASATGNAPPQRLFTIGGYGTIPGYDQNAYGGNRLLLLQTDLIVRIYPRVAFCLIFENNIGGVTMTSPDDGALAAFPELSALKYSTGIYLGFPTGSFRAGFAFRTDIFADPEFVVRLSRPF